MIRPILIAAYFVTCVAGIVAQAPVERRTPANPAAALPQAPSAVHLSAGTSAWSQAPAVDGSLAAQAADPISSAAVPQPSNWPSPTAVPSGTTLLVKSTDAVFPHICRVQALYEQHVVCEGPSNPNEAAYSRAYIDFMQFAPKGYEALSVTKRSVFYAGGLALLLGVLADFDEGGSQYIGYTGLSLLATGVVLHFVQMHERHKHPRMLYSAMGLVSRSAPKIFGVPVGPETQVPAQP